MYIDFQLDRATLEAAVTARVTREIHSGTRWVRGIQEIPLSLGDPTPIPVVVHRIDPLRVAVQVGIDQDDILGRYPRGVDVRISTIDEVGPYTPTIRAPLIAALATLAVRVVRVEDLVRIGHRAIPTRDIATVFVRVALSVSVVSSATGATLQLALLGMGFSDHDDDYIDGNLLPQPPPAEVIRQITDIVARLPRIPLETGSLTNLLGPDARVWNSGLMLSGDALTIRLQVEAHIPTAETAANWLTEWTQFFTAVPNRLAGRQWALFIPAGLFGATVEHKVRSGLEGREELAYESLEWTWSPDRGGTLTVRIRVVIFDACIPWGVDLHANVTVTTSFSLVDNTTLRTELQVGYGPDPGELVLCSIGNAILLALAGVAIGGSFGGEYGAIAGAIVGFLGGMVTTLVVGDVYETDLDLDSQGLTPVEGTTDRYFLDTTLPANSAGELGTVQIAGLSATASTLSLGGTITIAPGHAPNLELLEPEGFQWAFLVPCTSNNAGALASIHGLNRAPGALRVTHVEVLPPTPPTYTGTGTQLVAPTTSDVFPPGSRLTITEWLTKATLDRIPIGDTPHGEFRLLIQTTGGARIVTIPGVGPTLTADALARSQSLHDFACANRLIPRHRFPLARRPPIIPGAVSWVLRGANFRARTGVRVIGTASTFAMQADARGTLGMRWWEAGERASDQIEVELLPSPDGPSERAQVVLARGDYLRTARIPLSKAAYRSHALGHRDGHPALQLVTARGIDLIDLADPYRPSRISRLRRPNLIGGLVFNGKHVLWGADGLWIGEHLDNLRPAIRQPILDAVTHRGRLIVLDHQRVQRLDADGTARETISHTGATRFIAANQLLIETPTTVCRCDFKGQELHPQDRPPEISIAKWSGRLATLLSDDAIDVLALVEWEAS